MIHIGTSSRLVSQSRLVSLFSRWRGPHTTPGRAGMGAITSRPHVIRMIVHFSVRVVYCIHIVFYFLEVFLFLAFCLKLVFDD